MSENISVTQAHHQSELPLSLENTQLSRAILDHISDFVIYVDRAGRILFANRAFASTWQKSSEAIEGRHFQEILTDEFSALAQPHLQKAFTGERETFMAHIARPAFQPHWMKVTLTPDLTPQGNVQGCFFILNDVTELMKAHRKVSEFHEATMAIAKAQDLISMRNAISDAILNSFGASAGLLVECAPGPTSYQVSGRWNHLAPMDSIILECLRTKAPLFIETEAEFKRLCPDYVPQTGDSDIRACAALPMMINNELIGALIFGFSIERRFPPQTVDLMETLATHCGGALKRVCLHEDHLMIKERLSLATAASDIGIWDYIAETQQLNWSEKQQEIYGVSPGSFRHSYEHYQELLHPEDRDFVNRSVDAAIKNHKPYTLTHRVIWPDGSVHWIQSKGKPYFDQTGKLLRIIGTTISIDERKRFESELGQAIQSRDDFISIASHELKTPLTSLKLQTDIIRRATRKDPAFQLAPERILKLADQMDQQIQRLTRLIDDMLDASRVGTGKLSFHFDLFNLSTLLNEISSRFASRFQQAGIAFKLNAQAGVELRGDADRIEQVISNLYTNAIRYAAGSQLETSMLIKENDILIQVKDTGPGITLEAQNRIFSRFERADALNKAPGLGLGLYISKEIIEGHGGKIQVDSAPGKGASFTIRLPLKSC
jgi:PAS domain S-box-containing protein